MKFVETKCSVCGKLFPFRLKFFNNYNKQGLKIFCSKECSSKSRIKSIPSNCSNCGKKINVPRKTFKKRKSKNFFCSRTCSTQFIFLGKKRNELTKEKIRNSIIEYCKKNNKRILPIKNCALCGKEFKCISDDRKCCSRKCGQIYKFGSLPYTKEEVVNTIISLSQKLNRTPQQRDGGCHRLVRSAVKFFGSWNKTMESCGLKPNPTMLHRMKLKCKDGHIAESISEKIVDEWLFKNEIKHERTKKYPGNKYFNCDFYLNDYNIWLEYFGMINNIEEYDKVIELKRQIAKDNNLKFIEIIPSDLYPKNKLDSFLPKITGKEMKQEGLFDNVKVIDVKMICNAPIE